MGHREAITDYGSRIAKLGTRPKGGSPEGNCELEKAKSKEQMTEDRGAAGSEQPQAEVGDQRSEKSALQPDILRIKYNI